MSLAQQSESEAASPVPIIETDDQGNPIKSSTANGYFPSKGHSNIPASSSLVDDMAHLSVVGGLNRGDDSDAASVRSSSSRTSRKPQMKLASYQDEFTTSVYGSRFAGMDLPRHHMPENEMPRDIAYRMIKDDLSLDNNPMLKYVSLVMLLYLRNQLLISIFSLASFVTTYMVRTKTKLIPLSFLVPVKFIRRQAIVTSI
jgi:glutamate decarboxylase